MKPASNKKENIIANEEILSEFRMKLAETIQLANLCRKSEQDQMMVFSSVICDWEKWLVKAFRKNLAQNLPNKIETEYKEGDIK